jgi:hypothetical protein
VSDLAGDDDYLDGTCDLDAPMLPPVPDAEAPWHVLFASVLYDGPAAIEAHAAKWRALFPPRGDRP